MFIKMRESKLANEGTVCDATEFSVGVHVDVLADKTDGSIPDKEVTTSDVFAAKPRCQRTW